MKTEGFALRERVPWVDPGRPGVPPLRNGMWRRVREAAPYMGWNLGDRWVWDPPLRRIWKRSLLFRRGRTLAGPPKGLCHSGAQPHPPRIRSAPSPWKGEGFRAADSRPYGGYRSCFVLSQGPVPDRPACSHMGPPLRFSKIFPGLGRGGPWASRRQRPRYRLLGKPRRGNGAAEPEIFAYPAPSGPGGEAESHSDFARRNYCRT